jgi:MSHA biogenesis protein MshN
MSLINQMLKDLEERRSQPGAVLQEDELLTVHSVPAPETDSRSNWRTLLFGSLLMILLSGFGWWGYRTLSPPPVVPLAVARQLDVMPTVIAPVASVESVAPVPKLVTPVVPAPVVPAPVIMMSKNTDTPGVEPVATEVAVPVAVEKPANVVAVTKVERPLSPREKAEAAFHRALTAQRGGERAAMEMNLRQALVQDPSHYLAREKLAALLYHAGHLDEAKEVLRGGMTESSAPIPLRKTLARFLVDQDAPEEAALALLQGDVPPVALDKEFYQLLAAIYQRTGQFSAAARTYKELLTVQRQTGMWWLGLGLALESSQSLPEAKQAYRTALEDPAMQPGSGDFARSRLAALRAVGKH